MSNKRVPVSVITVTDPELGFSVSFSVRDSDRDDLVGVMVIESDTEGVQMNELRDTLLTLSIAVMAVKLGVSMSQLVARSVDSGYEFTLRE